MGDWVQATALGCRFGQSGSGINVKVVAVKVLLEGPNSLERELRKEPHDWIN